MERRGGNLRTVVVFVVIGAVLGAAVWVVLLRIRPGYTAQTAIEVIAQEYGDPLELSAPRMDRRSAYQLRMAKADQLKSEWLLQEVTAADDIRETRWFENCRAGLLSRLLRFPEEPTVRALSTAVQRLKRDMQVVVPKDGDYITVRFTCYGASARREAPAILNRMVDSFLAQQRDSAKNGLLNRLTGLMSQQARVARDLANMNQQLEEVLSRTERLGLCWEGENSYLHPLLTQLELGKVDLSGQIELLGNRILLLEKESGGASEDVPVTGEPARALSTVLQGGDSTTTPGASPEDGKTLSQKAQIQVKLTDARQEKLLLEGRLKNLSKSISDTKRDLAMTSRLRLDFEKVKEAREEKRRLVESVSMAIEKVRMLLDDPDLSRVRFLGPAAEPLAPSRPRLPLCAFAGGLAGFVVGLAAIRRRRRGSTDQTPASTAALS